MASSTFTHTWSPSFPWFSGSLATSSSEPSESGGLSVALPNTITLDGWTFPVEVREWRSGPQDTFRDTIVANSQPDDALFNAQGAWGRYSYSWHHGQGQAIADLGEGPNPFRYESAVGVEWHDKYQMTLENDTTLEHATATSGLVLCRSGAYVFVGDGTSTYRTTDLDTFTLMSGPGGTVQAMATDGTDLYVATSTKMVRFLGSNTTNTAWATPVTGNCTNVAFVADRVIVAIANSIYEVASTGALTLIKTHFQSAFRWTTIFNIGSRIYFGGFAGIRSELYTVTTDTSGNLVKSQEAAPLPIGELLRSGVSFAGAAVLCTSNGVRVAEVSGDGTLSYGPLLDEPGDVRCATADGASVYVGWSAIDGERSGVGRLVVDEEVAPLQPAYGVDVFEATVQAAVTGVVRAFDKTAFAVDGSGIWVSSATAYVGQGELNSGRITFGTVETKALVGISLVFAPLQTSESIEVYVYDDDGVIIGTGTASVAGSTEVDIDLNGERVSFCKVKVILSGPGTTTPTLYRWRIRGYPVPPMVLQWVLPLIVNQAVVVNAGNGQQMSMDIDAINTWIEGLAETRAYTILRVGTRSYRVRVDKFEWRPSKWSDDGALPVGQLIVQLVNA